jgi:hypothetical protein
MPDEGKYLYCIIEEASHRTFGPIGIGERGDEVHTLCHRDLACVISSSPITEGLVNRNNLMSHETIIEKVMKDYTVLPIRFGTIATSNDEVRSLLIKKYHEFKNLLRTMDNKVEMGSVLARYGSNFQRNSRLRHRGETIKKEDSKEA